MRRQCIVIAASLLCSPLTANEMPASDLLSLYHETMVQDPSILRAKSLAAAATARTEEARGRLLPQLSTSSTYSRNQRSDAQTDTHYDGETHSLQLSQSIYNPSAWRNYQKFRSLQAKYLSEQDSARLEALAGLAEQYFATLAAEDDLILVKAELLSSKANLRQVNALHARQMARITDQLEVEAHVHSLQVKHLEAINTMMISREKLAERVGRAIEEPLRRLPEEKNLRLTPNQRANWLQTALQHNPALQALEHAREAAENAVGEALTDHWPTLTLAIAAQRSDVGYEASPAPRSDTLISSINLSLPLYTGGATSARSNALSAELDAATYEHEYLQRQIRREVRAAWLQLESSQPRLEAATLACTSTTKSREAAEQALRYGAASVVDVLEQQQEEYRARRNLLRAKYDAISSLLTLYRWSGLLNEQHLSEINQLLQ